MAGNQPTAGDVIIAPDTSSGRGFTLSVAPDGASQLWYPSFEHAVEKAFHWASSTGVAVWRADGTSRFDRIPLRNPAAFRNQDMRARSSDDLLSRIRSEYIEMPGLWLTTDQAVRLWGLEREQCVHLLRTLVTQGFLIVRADGKFGRASEARPGTSVAVVEGAPWN